MGVRYALAAVGVIAMMGEKPVSAPDGFVWYARELCLKECAAAYGGVVHAGVHANEGSYCRCTIERKNPGNRSPDGVTPCDMCGGGPPVPISHYETDTRVLLHYCRVCWHESVDLGWPWP